MGYILFAAYLVMTSTGLLLIKTGTSTTTLGFENSILSVSVNIRLLIGLTFYVISFLMYVVVLGRFDLSYIYPIGSGIVTIISVVAGVFLLKERISTPGVVGVVLIIIGVFMMNIKRA